METFDGYICEPEMIDDNVYFAIRYGVFASLLEGDHSIMRHKQFWADYSLAEKVQHCYDSRWNAIYSELRVRVWYTKVDNQVHDIKMLLG